MLELLVLGLLIEEPEPGLLDRVVEIREADPFSHLEPIPLEVKQEQERREEEERQTNEARAEAARQAAAREEARNEEVRAESSTSEQASSTGTDYAKWEPIARCESGYGGAPQWGLNTGNGYYGGLQFNLNSWQWVGGEGYPHHANKEEQIKRAEILLERQGWGAWPVCSQKVGYR